MKFVDAPDQYSAMDMLPELLRKVPGANPAVATEVAAAPWSNEHSPLQELGPLDYLGIMTKMLQKATQQQDFHLISPAGAVAGPPPRDPNQPAPVKTQTIPNPNVKDTSRLSQDPNAKESVSYNPTQVTPVNKSTSPAPKAGPIGEALYSAPAEIGQPARPAPSMPAGMPQPAAAPSGMDTFRRVLLQTGLSLMAGKFGNPLSQIGQSLGEGVGAVANEEKLRKGDDQQKLDQFFKSRTTDIAQQHADADSTKSVAALESSRSKRLGKTTPEDLATEGMDPVAKTYFKTRLKALNSQAKPDPLSDQPNPDPQVLFQQLMKETQQVDVRARANSGRLRADEVSDNAIKTVVADPTKEQILLNQVRADPIQLGLLRKRLEAARGVSNAGR